MNYRRIERLPENCIEMESSELRGMQQIWQELREELRANNSLDEFLKKLYREWAIETGLIERLYSWDRGVTETLIAHGTDASIIASTARLPRDEAERAHRHIEDHRGVVEGLWGMVKEGPFLTEHTIRSLHQALLRSQECTEAVEEGTGKVVMVSLLKGEYKKLPNNPTRPDGSIHEYCPPILVQEEMERLVTWCNENIEQQLPPEIVAAWLHHRFTQIHPFQDGNGRMARTLAGMVFVKHGLIPPAIRNDQRESYIGALEQADEGDLTAFVAITASSVVDKIKDAIPLMQVDPIKVSKEFILEQIQRKAVSVSKKENNEKKMRWFLEEANDRLEKRINSVIKQVNLILTKSQSTTLFSVSLSHQFCKRKEEAFLAVPRNNPLGPDEYKVLDSTEHSQYSLFSGGVSAQIKRGETTKATELEWNFTVLGLQEPLLTVMGILPLRKIRLSARYPSGGFGSIPHHSTLPGTSPFFFNYAEDEAKAMQRFQLWLETVEKGLLADLLRALE